MAEMIKEMTIKKRDMLLLVVLFWAVMIEGVAKLRKHLLWGVMV